MLWFIGACVCAFVCLRLVPFFFPKTIVDLSSLNGWAVVTGATDGIGWAFACELARRGFDVVLVSRDRNKLDKCSSDIRQRFGVSTKTVTADFSKPGAEMNETIKAELRDMKLAILVNNVGTMLCHPEFFLDIEKHHESYYEDILHVNIFSVVTMTRAVLPEMVKRGRGLVINVSSGFGEMPQPLNCLYSSTKAFINKFSQDLDLEYNSRGVHVHVLTTGLVQTKLSGATTSTFFSPTPTVYVRSALDQVQRHRATTGYVGHDVFPYFIEALTFVCPSLASLLMSKGMTWLRARRIKQCEACREN